MAAPSIMLDDSTAFTNLLTRWTVPDAVQVKLRDAGYSTVALLAHALPSLDDLQAFLESLLGRASWSQRKLVTSQRLVCRALVVNQVPQGTREAAQPNLVEDQGRAKATLLPEGPYRSSRSGRTGPARQKRKSGRSKVAQPPARKGQRKDWCKPVAGSQPGQRKGQRLDKEPAGGLRVACATTPASQTTKGTGPARKGRVLVLHRGVHRQKGG